MTSLKILVIFWQLEMVDNLTLIQCCLNSGSQYAAIVLASASENFSSIVIR